MYLDFIPVSMVEEKYDENFGICKDKNIAIEDTICEMIDYLADLEEEDYDTYKSFFGDILEVYYMYNKYLLDNDRKTDEYASDIVDKLVRDKEGFINYSCSNEFVIEPVIRDYLSYCLLDKNEKKKINEHMISSGEYFILNPNELIREFLSKTFSGLNASSEECVYEYKDVLDFIKNDIFILNTIAPVLYIDELTYSVSKYISSDNKSSKTELDFIKNISTIDEYKQYLIENDYNFLVVIYKSIYLHFQDFIDKKTSIINMIDGDYYADLITNNYIFDIMEFYRKYQMKDVYDIYNIEYKKDNNEEQAAIRSSATLANNLLDVRLIEEDNYKELMKNICKIFYSYEKYKIFAKDKSITTFDDEILKRIEKDTDEFINSIVSSYGELIYILQVFYEYCSLPMHEISEIKQYVDNDLINDKVIKKLNHK